MLPLSMKMLEKGEGNVKRHIRMAAAYVITYAGCVKRWPRDMIWRETTRSLPRNTSQARPQSPCIFSKLLPNICSIYTQCFVR